MAKKRDALKALERRKEYLEQKLETEEYSGRSYDLAECGALEYAINTIERTPEKKCPFCHNPIYRHPAISRVDNKTEICSMCGAREALEAFQDYLKNNAEDELNETR